MAKKKKCPEFENHERWLVAYADMMTLLFALFVVLYSITNVEIEKLKSVKASIQKAFGFSSEEVPGATGLPSGNSQTEGIFSKMRGNTTKSSVATKNRREIAAIIAVDIKSIQEQVQKQFQGTADFPAVAGNDKEKIVYFNQDADGIRVSLLARGFFKPGEFQVQQQSKPLLDGIAVAIKGLERIVRVEGHTDNSPYFKNGITNWELSSVRAASVVRYFIDHHSIPSNMIYAAGFSDTKPISPNDTPEHRSLNRRIDIKILYDTPSDFVPVNEEKQIPKD